MRRKAAAQADRPASGFICVLCHREKKGCSPGRQTSVRLHLCPLSKGKERLQPRKTDHCQRQASSVSSVKGNRNAAAQADRPLSVSGFICVLCQREKKGCSPGRQTTVSVRLHLCPLSQGKERLQPRQTDQCQASSVPSVTGKRKAAAQADRPVSGFICALCHREKKGCSPGRQTSVRLHLCPLSQGKERLQPRQTDQRQASSVPSVTGKRKAAAQADRPASGFICALCHREKKGCSPGRQTSVRLHLCPLSQGKERLQPRQTDQRQASSVPSVTGKRKAAAQADRPASGFICVLCHREKKGCSPGRQTTVSVRLHLCPLSQGLSFSHRTDQPHPMLYNNTHLEHSSIVFRD